MADAPMTSCRVCHEDLRPIVAPDLRPQPLRTPEPHIRDYPDERTVWSWRPDYGSGFVIRRGLLGPYLETDTEREADR